MKDQESKTLAKQIKRYAQVGGVVGKLATKLASQKYLGVKLDKEKHALEIREATLGEDNSIGITTGGTNYKVDDKVVFDNTGTGGVNAQALVKRIGGQQVNTISVASTSFSNVELIPSRSSSSFVGIVTAPHNLINGSGTSYLVPLSS